MADKNIVDLDVNGTLTTSDLLELYQPAQTPKNRQLSLGNLRTWLQTAFASLVISASGIKFPATQIPSADANTLDDYEEGVFIPNITFGGGSTGIAYSVQQGQYTKHGRTVIYTLRIILTSKGSSTGNAVLTGMPFNCNSVYYFIQSLSLSGTTFSGYPQARVNISTDQISLLETTTGGTFTTIDDTNFSGTDLIIVSGIYTV